MSGWNRYLFSLVSCCLCCGIVLQIISDTAAKALIRTICAVVVLLSVISPLTEIDRNTALQLPQTLRNQGDFYVTEGRLAAREAASIRIEASCRTYILEKAKSLDCGIESVHITLDETLLPVSAEIRGRGQSGARDQLEEILMKDLGIPKEQLSWIWNQENSSSGS